MPLIKYHVRWNELTDQDFYNVPFQKGAIINNSVVPGNPGEPVTDPVEIPELALEYFEKIRALCRENNIKLLVYQAPFGEAEGKEARYQRLQGIMLSVEKYCEKEGIPFLFYQKTGEVSLDWETDMRNAEHMNIYGGEKLTRVLGDYLVNNYDLPSHKGEENYRDWNEVLADYKELREMQDQGLIVEDLEQGDV